MRSGRVHLIVALSAEARPLIDHFGLSVAGEDSPFREHSDPDGRITLVVSGSGRVAAGAAVASLAQSGDAAWLNVGIAGHPKQRLGSTFLAHRITDDASQRAWYPPIVFEPPCPTAPLRTVDRACRDLPTDELYDMEASGFYSIATRFATHELIHAVKVVSDNRYQQAETLTRERVGELIGANLRPISAVVELLCGLSADEARGSAEPAALTTILSFTHFTTSQRRRLRRLLRRFAALFPQQDAAEWLSEAGHGSAREMLSRLEAHLEARAPDFEDPA